MTTRSFKNFNASAFREDLKSAPWDSLRNCTTPDEMVEIWENMFLNIADAHAPIRTRRVRNKKSPWITTDPLFCSPKNHLLRSQAINNDRSLICILSFDIDFKFRTNQGLS